MTKKDYVALATAIGNTLAIAAHTGGEEHRTEIYEALYSPLADHCESDNPDFDRAYFSAFVCAIELAKLGKLNLKRWETGKPIVG